MFGQGRFAQPSSRAAARPKNCGSAGIAGMLTFILTNPVRWKSVFAAGRKKYPTESARRQTTNFCPAFAAG